MLRTGEKGKVYGLVQPNKLKPSVFARNDDDDDETDVNAQLREVSRKKQKQAQLEQERLKKEDPTVYDYDGMYDQMQATKHQAVPVKQPERKSKYIGALMEKAKVREREWAYDAKLQRERKNEDETFAGKEKFVTSAYKKKLQEDLVWKAEEARRAALEEDVTKRSNLNSFYKNLLDGNEAYGGIKEKSEEKKPKDDRKDRDSERGDTDRKARDDESEDKDRKHTEKDGEREGRKRGRDEDDGKKETSIKEERKEAGDKDVKQEKKDEEEAIKKEEDVKEEEGSEKSKEREEDKEKEVRVPPKKLEEDAVNAARLRYLQRKGLA